MLKRAAKESVVVDYTKFYDFFFLNSEVTLSRLPYFDGDYWSNAAGSIIKDFEEQSGGGLNRKVKKQVTKRTLKAMGHNTLSSDATKALLVMQKVNSNFSPKPYLLILFCIVCDNISYSFTIKVSIFHYLNDYYFPEKLMRALPHLIRHL